MNLKNHYYTLKKSATNNEQKKFKEDVIEACHISKETFYRWLRNPEQIPPLALEKIKIILKNG